MSLIEILQGVVLMTSITVLPGLFAMFIVFFPTLMTYLWSQLWSVLRGAPKASRDDGYRGQRQTRSEQTRAHGPRGGQKTPPPIPRSPDPFQSACKLLGLAIAHDEPAFRAAYRNAIRRTHPDLGGSTTAAQRVNAAADLIRQRNGWG